ncbi:MAG: biotin--[acetyl-CoA-carboxylase] ligase [bacterium]|nr:biotin--[acetyl-CoA-carboxylase] ligase [bacterium]MDE0290294.1 biotin--[acetyl-CoA-carboxylase] ligase [bacterium]MDE0440332.1 biotin--[acetyl-CoA-carboxylase] ligase [bacterium]
MSRPYETLVLEQTTSTQDEVRRRIDSRPVLVVAGSQTRGRGRTGADWVNAPRALAASIGFRPAWPSPWWPVITLVAGVAALRSLGGAAAGLTLKWPNDLMKGDDKLGGILTEASGGSVIVGWGANLHWPDAPSGRDAVYPSDPGPDAALGIAGRWAAGLLEFMASGPQDWPYHDYRRRCSTLGREITWNPNGRGRAVDISPEGGLVVATPAGRITLVSGSVSEVRRHGKPGAV